MIFPTLATLLAVLLPLAASQSDAQRTAKPQAATNATIPSTTPATFKFVDIYIDPHGSPLGAYQFEFIAQNGDVEIVGIEGGEHPAFTQPPYYDPGALQNQNRVILAALSTNAELPATKIRIARIHLRISGTHQPTFQAKLSTAVTADEKPIVGELSVEEGAQP